MQERRNSSALALELRLSCTEYGLLQEKHDSSALAMVLRLSCTKYGLVQERRNSSALAMELHLSCTIPSKFNSCFFSQLYLIELDSVGWLRGPLWFKWWLDAAFVRRKMLCSQSLSWWGLEGTSKIWHDHVSTLKYNYVFIWKGGKLMSRGNGGIIPMLCVESLSTFFYILCSKMYIATKMLKKSWLSRLWPSDPFMHQWRTRFTSGPVIEV